MFNSVLPTFDTVTADVIVEVVVIEEEKKNQHLNKDKKELVCFYFLYGKSVVRRLLSCQFLCEPDLLHVALTYIGDNIAYQHGSHFCQEVYPYRNQDKV
jgi:hypothetical protein